MAGRDNGIVVEGLAREFKGGIKAVDGIDLQVAPGEIYGFLGPNGAGKSTTVLMLVTLLPPTGGRATVAGMDVTTHGPDIRRPLVGFRRVDGDKHDLRLENVRVVRRKMQPPTLDAARKERFQTWLMDRALAALQHGDPCRVRVNAIDVVSEFGETGGRYRTNIAATNDSNPGHALLPGGWECSASLGPTMETGR
mgnify:CR=1 FL=1